MKTTLTLWKDQFALHCPNCDNVHNLEWVDGRDLIGEAIYRCPVCLTEFVATGKLFKTDKQEHGRMVGAPFFETESTNSRSRRKARE